MKKQIVFFGKRLAGGIAGATIALTLYGLYEDVVMSIFTNTASVVAVEGTKNDGAFREVGLRVKARFAQRP